MAMQSNVDINLRPDAQECLLQLFLNGPTWDGNIVSKAGRQDLADKGLCERRQGWTSLTQDGFFLALRLGLGDEKERRDYRRLTDSNLRHRALVTALLSKGTIVLHPHDELTRKAIKFERHPDGSTSCSISAEKPGDD